MATMTGRPTMPRKPISSDGFERGLAYGALVLLAAAVTAIVRGHAEWDRVPAMVWFHLLTILVALVLTPAILLRRRGDRRHRLLGRVWVASMLATAATSLFVHQSGPGRFSVIHLLSAWVLVQAPLIWWSARAHRLDLHRKSVRGMVLGALLIAGFFTFPFHRLLGHWLFAGAPFA
jgi:uncharacterized membrane protein